MALIICKECGNEYSDIAEACPNCGCPKEQTEAALTPTPEEDLTVILEDESDAKADELVVEATEEPAATPVNNEPSTPVLSSAQSTPVAPSTPNAPGTASVTNTKEVPKANGIIKLILKIAASVLFIVDSIIFIAVPYAEFGSYGTFRMGNNLPFICVDIALLAGIVLMYFERNVVLKVISIVLIALPALFEMSIAISYYSRIKYENYYYSPGVALAAVILTIAIVVISIVALILKNPPKQPKMVLQMQPYMQAQYAQQPQYVQPQAQQQYAQPQYAQQQADVRMQPQYAQQVQYAQAQPQYGQPQAAYGVEKPSKLWGLLGGCVPIAGLILFLVWKDKQPHNAKYAGIGAIIGFVVGIISYIILQVCLAAMYSYY